MSHHIGQRWSSPALALALATAALPAAAAVSPVGVGAFPASSLLVTFTGLADGLEVNGLSTNGLSFTYSLGNGQVIIDGGPGTTNNISVPNVVSVGDPSGTLTISLPGPSLLFGYGYSLLASGVISNGTTMTLLSGAVSVGSLSYTAVPDPGFPGGFAGIQSTLPFDSVRMTFASSAPAWALDNVRVSAVPEPVPLALFGAGLALLAWRRLAARQSAGAST